LFDLIFSIQAICLIVIILLPNMKNWLQK